MPITQIPLVGPTQAIDPHPPLPIRLPAIGNPIDMLQVSYTPEPRTLEDAICRLSYLEERPFPTPLQRREADELLELLSGECFYPLPQNAEGVPDDEREERRSMVWAVLNGIVGESWWEPDIWPDPPYGTMLLDLAPDWWDQLMEDGRPWHAS